MDLDKIIIQISLVIKEEACIQLLKEKQKYLVNMRKKRTRLLLKQSMNR